MRRILALILALFPAAAQAQQLAAPTYRKLTITGTPSDMSFRAPGGGVATTLADLLSQRFKTTTNDISTNPYTGFGPLTPFGNTDAQSYIYSNNKTVQNSILGLHGLSLKYDGSGTFGAGANRFTLFLANEKNNWYAAKGAAAKEGEGDVAFFTSRQGKKGDTAAIIMDVVKRRDALLTTAPDESGSPIMLEGNVALMDASGNSYHRMHPALGFAESPGGTSSGRGYGALMETRGGTWFSAYHAGSFTGIDESGVQTPNGWIYYFSGSTGRGPQTVNYAVDSNGRTFSGFPYARVSHGYNSSLDAYEFQDQGGATLAAIGRSSKIVTAAGGVQIGLGKPLVYRNAASIVATIPSLESMAVSDLATLAIPGAQPGDLVTTEIVSADAGLASYRLSGAVTAPNQVAVRVQNLTGTAGGGVPAAITAKVERFQ